MDIFAEIKKMIVNTFAIDEDTVVADAHLQDDLAGDSINIVRLAEAIETHYGIEIIAEDVGGHIGRSVLFDTKDGSVVVKTVHLGDKKY